jgi:hypothetical protein
VEALSNSSLILNASTRSPGGRKYNFAIAGNTFHPKSSSFWGKKINNAEEVYRGKA